MAFNFDNDSIAVNNPETISISDICGKVNQFIIDKITPEVKETLRYLPETDTIELGAAQYTNQAITELLYINIGESDYCNILFYPKITFRLIDNCNRGRHIYSINYFRFGIEKIKLTSNFVQFINPLLVGHWARIWLYSYYMTCADNWDMFKQDISIHLIENNVLDELHTRAYINNPKNLISFLCCIAAYKDEFDKALKRIKGHPDAERIIAFLAYRGKQLEQFIEYSCNACKLHYDKSKLIPSHIMHDCQPVNFCDLVLQEILKKHNKLKKEFNYDKATGKYTIPERYYKAAVMVTQEYKDGLYAIVKN